jgi:hypothetical protein
MIRWLTACMLALGLLAWIQPAQALPKRTWIVSIGNNTGDASEVRLRYAESDALAFVDVMRQLGGVASDRTRLVLDADAETVQRTLRDLRGAIRDSAGGGPTALLVYYSGHADATALHLGGTHLPFTALRALVSDSPASLQIMIVDACRSGNLSRVKGGAAAPAFNVVEPTEAPTPEGFAVLTSSAAGEASQESDRLGSSFFSHHLFNGIRGAADRNEDRKVTLTEAYDYAYNQTVRTSGRTLSQQHPTYAFGFKGRGGLVLSELDRPDPRRVGTLQLREASVYVVRQGHSGGPIAAEIAPSQPSAVLYLPPGAYFVQQRLPRLFREFQISIDADQPADLAKQPFTAIEYDRLVRRRGATQRTAHRFALLAGARGEVVPGEGPVPQLVLGYRLDLRWFAIGLRGRASTVTTQADAGLATRRHDELGLGLTLERYVDLQWLSVGVGLIGEGALGRQVFDTDRVAADRSLRAASFGGLLALERHLGAGFGLRLEGGPLTVLANRAEIADGAQTSSQLHAELVWWTALGLTWSL